MKVYSLTHCPYCKDLKDMLDADGILYEDVNCDLEENHAEFLELMEHTKCSDLPMVLVDHQILIPDVSFKSITEAYRLTKRILG